MLQIRCRIPDKETRQQTGTHHCNQSRQMSPTNAQINNNKVAIVRSRILIVHIICLNENNPTTRDTYHRNSDAKKRAPRPTNWQ